jgi:hypothetical protein
MLSIYYLVYHMNWNYKLISIKLKKYSLFSNISVACVTIQLSLNHFKWNKSGNINQCFNVLSRGVMVRKKCLTAT